MKKITLLIIALLFSPVSFAQYAKGTIDEIKVCSTGNLSAPMWIRTLQFKIADKWYATYAEFYGNSENSNNNVTTSLVLMAYAQNAVVEAVATGTNDPYFTRCGTPVGKMFHINAGDYIKLSR